MSDELKNGYTVVFHGCDRVLVWLKNKIRTINQLQL
jgi:hypothetical protein